MIQNVGSQALNQLSTTIRPKKKYKTNRKDLDGGSLDVQKHLSKLGELHMRTPTMKKYNYCGPGTRLEERLSSNDPKIRDPINNLDSICQKHDIAYHGACVDSIREHNNLPTYNCLEHPCHHLCKQQTAIENQLQPYAWLFSDHGLDNGNHRTASLPRLDRYNRTRKGF